MEKVKKTKQEVSHDEKIWGAISYLWILSLVALAARKNNPYVRFHANQGFLLFLTSLIWWFPIIGWVLSVVAVVAAVVGVVKSLQGEQWELPLVADVAKKLGEWFVKTIKL